MPTITDPLKIPKTPHPTPHTPHPVPTKNFLPQTLANLTIPSSPKLPLHHLFKGGKGF
ncbi:MAG: hypothetical protein LW716_12830 [Microcystis sp. 53602_E8]|nr:hypothetical protein [Microcystis sp. 53602_E8]